MGRWYTRRLLNNPKEMTRRRRSERRQLPPGAPGIYAALQVSMVGWEVCRPHSCVPTGHVTQVLPSGVAATYRVEHPWPPHL